MQTLTAVIYPGEAERWLVACNPETGTTTQGRNLQEALKHLKEATALYLEERRRQRGSPVVLCRGNDVCVVPTHREVDQGTLRGILRQANVTPQELVENL